MNNKQHACIFGRIPRPSWKGVLLEVTNRCNLLCRHCCNASSGHQEHALDTRTILNAVSSMASSNVNFIYVSGGEPLTRPDIFPVIQHMKSHGVKVSIATNGTLLNTENLRRLVKAGVDYVNISLDSLYEDVHDQLRGRKGAHRLAIDGIKRCVAQGVDLRVMSVLAPFNCESVEDFVLFLIRLGVKKVVFTPILPSGRTVSNSEWLFSAEKLKHLSRSMAALQRKYYGEAEIDCRIRTNPDGRPLDGCPGGKNLLHITAEGDVYPCSWLAKSVGSQEFILGNISDTPFEAILRRGLQIHRIFKTRGTQIKICQTCDKNEICEYGCPLFSVSNGCGLIGLDPICPRALDMSAV